MATTSVELKARQENREPTVEEYSDALNKAFNDVVAAGTMHTLAIAKAEEASRPRRGFFGWLFG